MKRTKRFYQMRVRQQSLYHISIVIYLICVQWISIDYAFASAAVVENKVTSPSRNEATNPLKEPTPSTLQGTFLNNNNLTDANNGSTSTPPADAPERRRDAAAAVTATTAWPAPAMTFAPRVNGSAVADRNGSVADASRPLESWQNVVHTSTEKPQFTSSADTGDSGTSAADREQAAPTGGDYGPIEPEATDLSNKSLMAKMLKSWFNGSDRDGGPAGGLPENDGKAMADQAAPKSVDGGNKGLFERWDEASEEQERVLEEAMKSERPGDGEPSAASSVLAADQNTPSRWFVLLLTGNSTVAQMRRTDFAKYLKLNLAARLSLEYDEVRINRVLVVPPRLMVNVSVVPVSERAAAAAAAAATAGVDAATGVDDIDAAAASAAVTAAPSFSHVSAYDSSSRIGSNRVEDDDPLHNLVETNATLMELSGEEYRVERFMSLKSQKPQTLEETAAVVSDRHADIDYFIYATVGPLCFAAVLGFLFLTLYKYVRKHPVQWPWKRKLRAPSFWPSADHRHRRMTDECGADAAGYGGAADRQPAGSVNVIYSGEFEQSQQQQLSGSWLDDASFVPDDSLDRIRTPTLLRATAQPQPHQHQQPQPQPQPQPAAVVRNKAFVDMLHMRGGLDDEDDARSLPSRAVQSPRLSRENKLRILGCKQSCLLLPAAQPVPIVAAVVRDGDETPPQ